MLLDLSSSVDGRTLDRLKAAVRDTTALLRPDDRIRLIAISQVLHEILALQPPRDNISLERLTAEGATSLYDGLAAAMMRPTEPGRRQLVLAFSDGRDSTSIVDEATARTIARLTDTVVDIVVPVGGNAPASVDPNIVSSQFRGGQRPTAPVVTGTPDELAARAQALKPWARQETVPAILPELVAPTAGQVFTFTPDESISSVFKRTLDDFRAAYVLQYVPQGVTREGWHDVAVTLKKPGKYDIRARKGYSGGPLDLVRPGSGRRARSLEYNPGIGAHTMMRSARILLVWGRRRRSAGARPRTPPVRSKPAESADGIAATNDVSFHDVTRRGRRDRARQGQQVRSRTRRRRSRVVRGRQAAIDSAVLHGHARLVGAQSGRGRGRERQRRVRKIARTACSCCSSTKARSATSR